jgi:glycosyltransferase involved in cell wall biosynthesis
MQEEEKRIGIFLYYPGSLKFHPSIMNSAQMCIEQGYKVDIFKCFNEDEGISWSDKLRVVHACKYRSNPILRLVSLLKFILKSQRYIEECNYSALIGIDAYGLILGGLLSKRSKAPLVYYSLEILSSKFNYITLIQKNVFERTLYRVHNYFLKLFERKFQKTVKFTVVQDQNRWTLLKGINKINYPMDVIFVPNSPFGIGKDEQLTASGYLLSKFGIENKIVVLYAGSLGEWTGIDSILSHVYSWPKDTLFLVHGRGNKPFIQKLQKRIPLYPNVMLSLDHLEETEYVKLIKAAHIGFVWYSDKDDPNVFTIGAASGKLFYYLKYGLPVISNKWPGLVDIIEGGKAGICVDSEENIGSSVAEIMSNYEYYSQNAKFCFEQYEFGNHFEKVIKNIQNISSSKLL